jgi:hypothetical protein
MTRISGTRMRWLMRICGPRWACRGSKRLIAMWYFAASLCSVILKATDRRFATEGGRGDHHHANVA